MVNAIPMLHLQEEFVPRTGSSIGLFGGPRCIATSLNPILHTPIDFEYLEASSIRYFSVMLSMNSIIFLYY